MWEQAVAQGVPCIFRNIPGFRHVDIGGNAYFIEDVSQVGISLALEDIFGKGMRYSDMKKSALKSERRKFLYSEIAKNCIKP